MTTLRIRTGRDADMNWIGAMHAALYPAEFGFDEGFAASINEKMGAFADKLDPNKRVWIVETDDGQLGSIALSTHASGEGFLNFVLVLPKARGLGLGRMLLDHALAEARKIGFTALRLETYSCLTAARGIYADYGFEMIECQKDQPMFSKVFDREFWRIELK